MSNTRLCPPPGYTSWLDYAVDFFDTRSLELESKFEDDPEKWHWPAGTTREHIHEAIRNELAELRLRAKGHSEIQLSLEGQRRFAALMEQVPEPTKAMKALGDLPDFEINDGKV